MTCNLLHVLQHSDPIIRLSDAVVGQEVVEGSRFLSGPGKACESGLVAWGSGVQRIRLGLGILTQVVMEDRPHLASYHPIGR